MEYEYMTYYLPSNEYSKIISEINTNYGKYEGKKYCVHSSYGFDGIAYWYYFENHGYNKYNIYAKKINNR